MKLPKHVLIPTPLYDSDIVLQKEKYGRKEWSIVTLFQKKCESCDNVGSYGFDGNPCNFDVNFCTDHMPEFKIFKKRNTKVVNSRRYYVGSSLKFKNWREPTKREEEFFAEYYEEMKEMRNRND